MDDQSERNRAFDDGLSGGPPLSSSSSRHWAEYEAGRQLKETSRRAASGGGGSASFEGQELIWIWAAASFFLCAVSMLTAQFVASLILLTAVIGNLVASLIILYQTDRTGPIRIAFWIVLFYLAIVFTQVSIRIHWTAFVVTILAVPAIMWNSRDWVTDKLDEWFRG